MQLEHRSFVSWLLSTHAIEANETLVCLFRNGTQLSLLNVSYILNSLEADCIATTVIIGCSVSFFGSLIVHGLIAALYYYRWKVRYLLFRGRRVFSPFQNLYHSLEGYDIQFEYDVYSGTTMISPFLLLKLCTSL